MKQVQKGFTLIELMIVIAIIGILAAIAVPQYSTYTKRAKFSEVIMAVTQFKTPAEIAFQTMGMTDVDELDAGSNGIPAAITSATAVGKHVQGVVMADGQITATGTTASFGATAATYSLQAVASNNGLQWTMVEADSSCLSLGFCSPQD